MRFFPALLAAACVLSAQIDPAAEALLKKSADFTRSAGSYSMEMTMTVETSGPLKNSLEMPMSVKWSKPDKMFVESKSPVGTMTIVSDGKASYIYMGGANQYLRREAAFSPAMILQMSGMPGNLTSSLMQKSVQIVREEVVALEGRETPCFVVESEYAGVTELNGMKVRQGKTTMWLAKDTGNMLRMESSSMMESPVFPKPVETRIRLDVNKMRLGETFSPKDFTFTPPPGAREIQQMAGFTLANGRPELIGKPLPPLQLTSLDGKPFDIAQFKGKTVLLNFWATWCGPCRAEIPDLKKLHTEWRDSDIVLIGVDVDEDASTVEGAINDLKINYPVVLAKIAENKEIGVHAYPTQVVVDPNGNILKYEVGKRSAEQFEALVGFKKATAEIR